jgi:hypothetical protein
MARMSREFTLVLLGAGLLTAGFFLWPDDDPAQKANDQANQGRVPAGTTHYAHTHLILLPGRTAFAPPAVAAGVSRGGFGGFGRFAGGGIGG